MEIKAVIVLLIQMSALDPSGFDASKWGVVGALVFVCVVLCRTLYLVFVKGGIATKERDQLLIDFVTGHTNKTSEAMAALGDKIVTGDNRVAAALESQSRMLQGVLLTWEVLQRARAGRSNGGTPLKPDEIEQLIRASHDAIRRSTAS